MSSKHRTILLDACAIACPLILVVAVRTFFAPAPSAAGTSPAPGGTQVPAVIPVAAAAKLTPDQQKAADWIAALPPMKGLASPLDHPVPATPPPSIEPQTAAGEPVDQPEIAPVVDPLAGIRLTGILGNKDGGLVAINGRIYKVGDPVRPGIKIKLINAATSTVTFSLEDGTELKLHRKEQ